MFPYCAAVHGAAAGAGAGGVPGAGAGSTASLGPAVAPGAARAAALADLNKVGGNSLTSADSLLTLPVLCCRLVSQLGRTLGFSPNVHVEQFDSERSLISAFVRLVRLLDPDVILGYEIQRASLGYLIDRVRVLQSETMPKQQPQQPPQQQQQHEQQARSEAKGCEHKGSGGGSGSGSGQQPPREFDSLQVWCAR